MKKVLQWLSDFFNSTSVKILRKLGFDVSPVLENRSLFRHFFMLALCIIMCVISFYSLNKIGIYLFLFHLLSLCYKWVLTLYMKKNCVDKAKSKKTKANVKIHSPYDTLFLILTVLLFVIFVIIIFAILKNQSITFDVLFTIATYFGILTALLWDILYGLVSIYGATPHITKNKG